ncbi:MAG TPA: hypothetical protein DCY88_17450 [Cyanobacteria bacterium UBA11372]|nr:hypothetical protein [Cyanobacteria bacterium UBA11372]
MCDRFYHIWHLSQYLTDIFRPINKDVGTRHEKILSLGAKCFSCRTSVELNQRAEDAIAQLQQEQQRYQALIEKLRERNIDPEQL